jgi:cell division protein FtsW (lipid II flippase)
VYYLALYLSVIFSSGIEGRWVYIITAIVGFVTFVFIAQVRRFIQHGEMEDVRERGKSRAKMRKTLLATEMERLKADQV